MSATYLRLIPTSPSFAPNEEAQIDARTLMAASLPHARSVTAEVTAGIQFVDQGGNFDQVLCPACGAILTSEWWGSVMDAAWGGEGFRDLNVTLPCCGACSTLNDLHYVLPAGFARFVLEARDPEDALSDGTLRELEGILGCKLRKIWARY